MADLSRIQKLISSIEVCQFRTDASVITIRFVVCGKARWFIAFYPYERKFGGVWRCRDDSAGPRKLRAYLLSILPEDILASCTAATIRATHIS